MMPLGFGRATFAHPSQTGTTPQATQFVDFNAPISVAGASTTLENSFASYPPTISSTNFGYVYNAITGLGYTILATPIYGAFTESLVNTSSLENLPNGGYFNQNVFRWDNYYNSGASFANHGTPYGNDNWNAPSHLTTLSNYSTTFGSANGQHMDGHPYLVMSFWSNNTYFGSLTMAFIDYTTGTQTTLHGPSNSSALQPIGATRLYDLWYPNQNRNIVVHQRNSNSGNIFHNSTQSYRFSNAMSPSNEHGTNTNTKFSADDGTWGFITGVSQAGGNSGDAFMSNNTGQSYGFNNENDGDTGGTAGSFYWGAQYSSTNYMAFIYTRFV
tara:strand:- start:2266 stop:3249 length:984 start_codon:yes stop_codon:yes gene_type:complete